MEGTQTSRASSVLSSALSTEDETMVDAVPEKEPAEQKTLLEQVFAALTEVHKQQGAGDVLVVFHVHDLSKSWRMQSAVLTAKSVVLSEQLEQCDVAGGDTTHGVKHILILEKVTESTNTGFLMARKGVDYSLPDHDRVEQIEAKPAAPVKKEAGHQEDNLHAHANASDVQGMKGYDNVLRILNSDVPDMHPTSASSALPDFESMLTAAMPIDAVEHIVEKLDHILTKRYERFRTLMPAIAEQAARWLNIAIIMENEIIFEDAFTHLAGQYPAVPDQVVERIPANTLQRIVRASEALFLKRLKTESALYNTTLEVDTPCPGPPATTLRLPVSVHTFPALFILLGIWHEWIRGHAAHLHDCGDVEEPYPANATYFCDHPNNSCLTVAGLYSVLYKGGDAYLDADSVVRKLRNAPMLKGLSEASIRTNLAVLKDKATEIVKPLLESNLRLPDKDGLEYLTCVDFKDDDIPWNRQE